MPVIRNHWRAAAMTGIARNRLWHLGLLTSGVDIATRLLPSFGSSCLTAVAADWARVLKEVCETYSLKLIFTFKRSVIRVASEVTVCPS